MPAFSLPPGLRGKTDLIRFSPRTVAKRSSTCSAKAAFKARPALNSTASYAPRGATRNEDFALGPVQAGIDLIEFGSHIRDAQRQIADQAARHTGLARFTTHAVAQYRPHARTFRDPHLHPVQGHWVVQKENEKGVLWEAFHWGRRYESPDGAVREFRFLRNGRALPGLRDLAETAVAAYVTAFGGLAPWPAPSKWGRPFQPVRSGVAVSRVRIVEIGLLDGSCEVLFDGAPGQVRALYAERGALRVREAVNGATSTPGDDCADCKRFATCTIAPRVPGLLGLSPSNRRPRSVSSSALRYFSFCPAQAYMRDLRLPKEDEYTPANQRGQAVHSWLEAAHTAETSVPCFPDAAGGRWRVGGERGLDQEQARLGTRMIAQHAKLCPFHAPVTKVRPEPGLTFVDTDVNVVVLAKPDLIYTENGTLVWREVKTGLWARLPQSGVMRRFPQLALAVVLLAEGALDNDPNDSRVELELLTPEQGDVLYLDPTDSDEVEQARQVLRELAEPWYHEQDFPTRPGPHCRYCPVSRWCPDAAVEGTG